eukprot:scaffold267169_cov35-Prasinocladus_malaysianus.AAC.2
MSSSVRAAGVGETDGSGRMALRAAGQTVFPEYLIRPTETDTSTTTKHENNGGSQTGVGKGRHRQEQSLCAVSFTLWCKMISKAKDMQT